MKARNYHEIFEYETPYGWREDNPIAWAMMRANADLLNLFEEACFKLADSYDLNQNVANSLERLGRIFGLERRGENQETFRAKILARISLDKSSGTYEDLQSLFDKLAGPENWSAKGNFPAGIGIKVDTRLNLVPENLTNVNQDNLITLSKDNLIVLLQDPSFASFLDITLASGVRLNIEEDKENG